MNQDVLSLGDEFDTWAIKSFSAKLRRQITGAARRQGCTVAEWLHGHFQRFGVDGDEFAPVKIAAVEPADSPAEIPGIDMAASLVNLAGQPGITKENRNLANRLAGIILRRATQSLAQPDRQFGRQPRIVAAKQVTGDGFDVVAAEHSEQGGEPVSDTADRL